MINGHTKILKLIAEQDGYKYLGLTINNGLSRFSIHFKKLVNNSHRLSMEILHIARRSFHKTLIANTMWETMAIPALTYGMEVLACH